MKVYCVGVDVIAFLQETNSDNATLEWDVDFADRQHSEMHSGLTRQIEYLQRVNCSDRQLYPLQVLYLSGEL